ncbi:MAG TPA: GH1 family beta-glucosidase [Flavisolibacter sp.]|nr:GH1 family beta-glucosidase [Flavisolibacter sp.]
MHLHSKDFGEGFTWGVSSSAYQTEGAHMEDGKGPSIWDAFTSLQGKVYAGQNGNNACNFYHRYIQDIILMQYLNIKNFRFSLSWSRIFPEGIGKHNDKGLDYYDRMIDFCLESEITPWVTLYHWDLPQALEQKGGWTNREIVRWFEDYVTLCIKKFGDRVKNWMVLNEPIVFTGAGYFLGLHAPGRKGLNNFLPAVHHAVLCQALGGKIIKSYCSDANAGTTISCSHIDPIDTSKSSLEASQRVDVITNRLFIEPLIGLGYPVGDLKILSQMEKYMYQGDESLMKFDMDFIGLQNYTREVVKYSSVMPYINARLVKASKRNVPHTSMDWEIYPEGMYKILKKFNAYKRINKFIITENGAAFNDVISNGHIQDDYRIDFIEQYLEQVLKAKNEGINIDGYFAWSFTDNFEWTEGFKQRFGLVYIDYVTQKRIIKSSGYWFRQFLENNWNNLHAEAI